MALNSFRINDVTVITLRYIFSFNSAELLFKYSLFRSTSSQQDNRHAFAEGISCVCVSAVFDGTLPTGGKSGTPKVATEY